MNVVTEVAWIEPRERSWEKNGEKVNVVWNQDEKWNYLKHDHEQTKLDAIQKKEEKKWTNEKLRNEKGTDLSVVHALCSKNMVLVERTVHRPIHVVARKLPSKLICINSWRSHMNKIKCLRVWHSQSQTQCSLWRRDGAGRDEDVVKIFPHRLSLSLFEIAHAFHR